MKSSRWLVVISGCLAFAACGRSERAAEPDVACATTPSEAAAKVEVSLASVDASVDAANTAAVAAQQAQRAYRKMQAALVRADAAVTAARLAEANRSLHEANRYEREYGAARTRAEHALSELRTTQASVAGNTDALTRLEQKSPGCLQAEIAVVQGVQEQLQEREQRLASAVSQSGDVQALKAAREKTEARLMQALVGGANAGAAP